MPPDPMTDRQPQLDAISRAIGSLEQWQREGQANLSRLEAKIDRLVDELRKRDHDLADRMQAALGRLELEFGKRAGDLERRVLVLEQVGAVALGERHVRASILALVSAVIGGALAGLVDWAASHWK